MNPKDKVYLNIPLLDNWVLRSNINNIIIARVENGREQETYFYSSIEVALQSFVEKRIKRVEASSISELLAAIKSLKTRLNTLLAPFKIEVVKC